MKFMLWVTWAWLLLAVGVWFSETQTQRDLLTENEKLLGMVRECADSLSTANDGWSRANSDIKRCTDALEFCSGQSRSGGDE